MASTWWIKEQIKDYAADPKPEALVELLTEIVERLEELDYEKQDRPSDEMW